VEVLLTKAVVVALAILGAALSSLASFLQARGRISPRAGQLLNYAGYGLMAVSMVLFALAGLWG
jgi:hypothetical protein